MSLDVQKCRSHFPSLESGYVFADNAGGSQCLKAVVDRISDYLLNTNVQLGADYAVSVDSTQRVASASTATALLVNAASPDEIVFGSSSTMLLENLARAMEHDFEFDEEIIVMGEHEANAGPWKKIASRRGLTVRYWHATPLNPKNPYSVGYSIPDLLSLITPKTRLVAFSACSNILGTLVSVQEVIRAARERAKKEGVRKVEFSVDCVAYAPHRRIDVRAWDVDYAVFSYYKTYGPHTAALYVRLSSLTSSLSSIAHHFLSIPTKPLKLMPGGPGYELLYGLTGVVPYLLSLTPSGSDLNASFAAIADQEQILIRPLLEFLKSQEGRGVRVVGSEEVDLDRAPTISFVVVGDRPIKSKDVVKVFDQEGGMGIRYGHFYAYTLVERLRIDPEDGVVRISLVHYNTLGEVERLISVLKEVLV